jgi:hypothetical protein
VKPLPSHLADKTDYARSIGYAGKRRVIVNDGRVASHGNQDWFLFCDACRRSTLQRKLNQAAPRGPHVKLHRVHCGYAKPVLIRATGPDAACDLLARVSKH